MFIAANKSNANINDSDTESENMMMDGMDNENRLNDLEFPISSDEEYETDSVAMSEEDDNEENVIGLSGFAASMAKVLKIKDADNQKSLILSKATKVEDIKKKLDKGFGFEIDGEVKDENSANEDSKNEIVRRKILERRKVSIFLICVTINTNFTIFIIQKYKRILELRVKPSFADIERERTFKKIATKGVVQLFNAVRGQQKDISKKMQSAGKLESRREKVLQNVSQKAFLNALMSGDRAQSQLIDNPVKKEDVKDESESSDEEDNYKSKTWGPLRNDYFTNQNSGWDKVEDENEAGDDNDSSSSNSD